MIKKIFSGGQTGADRAALDVAIKFNLMAVGFQRVALLKMVLY
jgi:hypothetical protein